MDDIAKYNQARWKALAEANALFTRPKFDLDENSAKELIDPDGRFGKLKGKNVLCLAGGGGQQSAAFSLLGADVTVFDISEEQLERDRKVAEHYRLDIKTVAGDMRDLSALAATTFDIIYHPYSLNFVPDASKVFAEVTRIIKPGGFYQVSFANPFVMNIKQENWNGEGYLLTEPYASVAEITYPDQSWVYKHEQHKPVPPPKEYKHRLGNLVNSLIGCGFILRHISDAEDMFPEPDAEPASWDHLVAYAPPWLCVVAIYRPDLKF